MKVYGYTGLINSKAGLKVYVMFIKVSFPKVSVPNAFYNPLQSNECNVE